MSPLRATILCFIVLIAVPTVSYTAGAAAAKNATQLMVGLTLIEGAAEKLAVCLDGTPAGYHIHRGYGSGANSWLILLQGGASCENTLACMDRALRDAGSSTHMGKQIAFTGILSNNAKENPDFFNWNRVLVRYCDGASFAGDGEDKAAGLQFRGRRIWQAAMDELMSKGMSHADQALLSGCSSGGLASILHCDEFRSLFPSKIRVKCLADAGLFIDAIDVSGGHTLRNRFQGVVSLQGVRNNLPRTCIDHLDATSCFFSQNLINHIRTPLFILSAAYDSWQITNSVAASTADPQGHWNDCKNNHTKCSASQIQVLQNFRNQMLYAVKGFAALRQHGLFINSCFAHCQSGVPTWFAADSPVIRNKTIALAVGDWFFDRATVKEIDCACPCDKSCHNVF